MHILQVTDSLATEFGGTAAVCANLSTELARTGLDVSVVVCEASARESRWAVDPTVTERQCRPAVPRRLGFCPQFPAVVAGLPRANVVHIHGLWRLHYLQAARHAGRIGAPFVVSLHGMLFEPALSNGRALKTIARWTYQDRLLKGARCLHATSVEEVRQARLLGFDGPIAIVPWGIDLPVGARAETAARRHVLYFGRLHPRKNLDVLLRAWAQAPSGSDSWRLVIAGTDHGNYRSALVALAAELGISDSIVWKGTTTGAEREDLYAAAGVLVLPSSFENFGLVVGEALARGVPVITTHGTPWASLQAARCGWWIPTGIEALSLALAEAMNLSDVERSAMGRRGRELIAERFSWPAVAAAMERLYAWAVDAAPQPAFVQLSADSSQLTADSSQLTADSR